MSLLDRSMELHEEFGSRRGVAECLLGYARVLCARSADDDRTSSMRRAAVVLAGSEHEMREQGAAYWPADVPEHEMVSDLVTQTMSAAVLAALRGEGERLSLAELRELASG